MDRSFPIQQLKENNEKVFEQIVKSYWSRIHSFANIYVIDKEVAEEIVQDAFLALWDQRENLDDATCLITYLMVVSRNKCLNYLKSLQLDVKVKDVDFHISRALKHLKSDLSKDYLTLVLCLFQFILMKK